MRCAAITRCSPPPKASSGCGKCRAAAGGAAAGALYAPGSWGPNAIHQLIARTPGGCPSSGPGAIEIQGVAQKINALNDKIHDMEELVRKTTAMRIPP
jgi:hypothetical protein